MQEAMVYVVITVAVVGLVYIISKNRNGGCNCGKKGCNGKNCCNS